MEGGREREREREGGRMQTTKNDESKVDILNILSNADTHPM